MDLTQNIPNGNSPFGPGFTAEVKVESPGRINLIGEHTDYNMGFVMPTAIDKKIFFDLRKNGSPSSCTIYSSTFDSVLHFDIQNFSKSPHTWENYILGVVNEILKLGKQPEGFDCIIKSELPIGAGISSSAALECGLATGLNSLFDLGLTREEIVNLSQAAENNFVGSNCGIMDQYASVMSRKGNLIMLDCLSLEAYYIPADFGTCKILLINTKVSHSIADSEYNTRRKECETAFQTIREHHREVKTLRDVNETMLNNLRENLSPEQYDRVLYVLQENVRVLKAAQFLKEGNLNGFGKLMFQSHSGLSKLYEVSCQELDYLVNYVRYKPYIYGARIMGGGFGGCTINIIESDKIKEFSKEISEAYLKEFGIKPDLITVVPDEGTVVRVA